MQTRRFVDLGIVSASKPASMPTAFVEDSAGTLFMINNANNNQLLKSTDKGDNWDVILTAGRDMKSLWYDRANELIYFYTTDNGNPVQGAGYWDIDGESFTGFPIAADTLQDNPADGRDIFIIGADIFVSTTYWDGREYYTIRKWDGADLLDEATLSPDAIVKFRQISYAVVVGTDAYFLTRWTQGGTKSRLLKFDSTVPSLTSVWDSTSYIFPDRIQRAISYDGDDILYMVLNRGGTDYLMSFIISTTTMTELAQYDIALQPNRSNVGTVPNEFEKAFGLTDEKIYEIRPRRNGVILLQDASGITDDNWIHITDNFAINNGGAMFEFQDVSEQMNELSYNGGIFPIYKKGSFQSDPRYNANWNEKDSIKVYYDSGNLEIWAKIINKYQDSRDIYHYDFDFYSNELARLTYDKTYTNDKTSEKLIDIIDNKCDFCYQSSSIVATATQYNYVFKRICMYMFSLARFLEREVLYAEPDGKVWSKAYDGLTATGKSWTLNDGNQNAKLVDIRGMARDRGGYFKGSVGITRATVRYKNNILTTKPDAPSENAGIIPAKEFSDAKLEASTEADQLATNRYTIGASTIQFIGLRVEGEGFLQEGKTIEIQNLGQIAITQADFVILSYIRFPKQDVTRMVLSDNIIFAQEFNSFMDTTVYQLYAANVQTFENQADIAGITISDIAYDEGTWNANTDAATKNVIRDKIESMTQTVSGTYTGNGNANRIISLGFNPKLIIVWRVIGNNKFARIRQDDFPAWHSSIQDWATHQINALNNDADGFKLNNGGANAEVNLNGSTYYYTVWK